MGSALLLELKIQLAHLTTSYWVAGALRGGLEYRTLQLYESELGDRILVHRLALSVWQPHTSVTCVGGAD